MLTNLILPITSFKWRYLPIIAVYFCFGFSTVTDVSAIFWTKESLSLSAQQLIQIAFWGNLPWTIKLVFAQLIENINIAGNRRKSYILIGAILILLGSLMLTAVANAHQIIQYMSIYSWLLFSTLFMSAGFVIQDLVADTLCAELITSNQNTEQYRQEAGIIQVIGRISLMSSMVIGAGLGGYLAEHYSFSIISLMGLVSPIISIIGLFFLPSDAKASPGIFNIKIMLLAILLAVASLAPSIFDMPYSQETSFTLNFIIIIALFKFMMKDQDSQTRKEIIILGIMLFFSRLSPNLSSSNFGSGITWWKIDELHFEPQFMATLSQTGNLFGLVGTWIFANFLLKRDIGYIIIILTLIKAALCLPEIAMSFGLHHWTAAHLGFGAHSIALVDESMSGPLEIILMAPTLALCVYFAPKTNKTTWLSLTACFLNLSLSASILMGKWLNDIFTIERGIYKQVSNLLVADFAITLLLPIVAVLICNRYRSKLN